MDNITLDRGNIPLTAFLQDNEAEPGMMDQHENTGMANFNTRTVMTNEAQMNPVNNLNLSDLERLRYLQQQLQAYPSFKPQMPQWQAPPVSILKNDDIFGDSLRDLPGLGSQISNSKLNLSQEEFMSNQIETASEMTSPVGVHRTSSSPNSIIQHCGTRKKKGAVEPFPKKLHRLLLEAEAAGRSDVISFVADGRAFAIHLPEKFLEDIVPHYFRHSRLTSFKRQLKLYGFQIINDGPARGGYFHELFVKDHPDRCRKMRRVGVKVVSKNSNVNTQNPSDEEGIVTKLIF
jgi:hypothetical protein